MRADALKQLIPVLRDRDAMKAAARQEAQAVIPSMTIRDLRTALHQRGLPVSGSRAEMEARLAAAVSNELIQGNVEPGSPVVVLQDGAAGAGDDGGGADGTGVQYIDVSSVTHDPAVTLAIVVTSAASCGAGSADGGGGDDSSALLPSGSSLRRLESCLAAARTLVDLMHTSPLPVAFKPASGLSVAVYYVDASLKPMLVPVSLLDGATTAAQFAAQAAPLALARLDGLKALTQELAQSAAVVFAAHADGGSGSALAVHKALADTRLPVLSAGGAAIGVGAGTSRKQPQPQHDRSAVLQWLDSANFPTLPRFRMSSSDLADPDAWASTFAAWVESSGWSGRIQRFVVTPCSADLAGGAAVEVVAAKGVEATCAAAATLLQSIMDDDSSGEGGGSGGDSVLIEPFVADVSGVVRFSVAVVDGPDGPVALMPTEIEVYDVSREMAKAQADLDEWRLLKEGLEEEEVAEVAADLRAFEPQAPRDLLLYQPQPRPLTYQQHVKHHCPPRLSLKTVQHIRHAAAKAAKGLGLRHGAMVTGWVSQSEGWRDLYAPPEDQIKLIPDPDREIQERLQGQAAEAEAGDVLPLSEYGGDGPVPDLARFDPATRLSAGTNGEATVFISDVSGALPLDAGSLLFEQAAHVGISHR